jgi:osmoprotectant transport system permease protein
MAALGLSSLVLLPFATLRASRIQTGDPVSALEALGPWWLSALVTVWLAIAVLSLRDPGGRRAAAVRGALAGIALLGTVGLSGVAATRLLAEAGTFARVSVGLGAWTGIAVSYPLLLASRRELGSARRSVRFALSAVAPAGLVVMLGSGLLGDLAILREYVNQSDRFWAEVVSHIAFTAIATGIALVVGFGLGVLAFRRPRLRGPVFAVANVFQTIPGLAMVGLLFAPLSWLGTSVPMLGRLGVGGLGWAPVITALTLYALLAVVRNTYAGLVSVPENVVEAGLGMGMTEGQVMRRVRLPLALPVIFGGIRTSAVQTLGNATLGAFVAAGTLGLFVFGGLSQQAMDLVLLGSITLVALALGLDGALRAAQKLVTPRHARRTEAVR